MTKILSVALVGCFAATLAVAADVTGKWTYETRGAYPETVTIDLKADGNLVTGSLTLPRAGVGNAPSVQRISHGHVDGNKVSFDVPTKLSGTFVITQYEGIVDGDIMHLTIKTDRARPIVAHRSKTAQEAPAVGSATKPSPLVASSENPGLKLATLDAGRKQRLAVETKLDLFLLKYNTSLLDDPRIMRYFIVLNNCADPTDAREIGKALNSEFDYPKMVAFYRTKAPEIFDGVPVTIRIRVTQFPNLTNNRVLPSIPAVLGDYDVTRKAFPFVNDYNMGLRETIGLDSVSPASDRGNDCGPAARQLPSSLGLVTTKYVITFKPFAFAEVPIDEAAAEAYVRRAGVPGGRRYVSLMLDLELTPEAPQSVSNTWKFAADIKKITVVDKSNSPVATLNP
jgi:hypothetical protein